MSEEAQDAIVIDTRTSPPTPPEPMQDIGIRVDTRRWFLERFRGHDDKGKEIWAEVIAYKPTGGKQAEVTRAWLADRHPKEQYRVRREEQS